MAPSLSPPASGDVGLGKWQYVDTLAGRGKYGVGDGRPDGGDARLAYARGRLGRGHNMHLDFRHLVHAQHRITVEVVLFDMPILERNGPVEDRPEAKPDAALHLGDDDVGIDRRTAVHCAHDPIDLDMSALIDADFGDLRDERLECFSDRDAAALAFRHRLAAPPPPFRRGVPPRFSAALSLRES